MEEGAWDEANTAKIQLEEKQRAARKHREFEAEEAALRGNFISQSHPQSIKKGLSRL